MMILSGQERSFYAALSRLRLSPQGLFELTPEVQVSEWSSKAHDDTDDMIWYGKDDTDTEDRTSFSEKYFISYSSFICPTQSVRFPPITFTYDETMNWDLLDWSGHHNLGLNEKSSGCHCSWAVGPCLAVEHALHGLNHYQPLCRVNGVPWKRRAPAESGGHKHGAIIASSLVLRIVPRHLCG